MFSYGHVTKSIKFDLHVATFCLVLELVILPICVQFAGEARPN